jgi:hypothetical protein
MKYNGLSRQDGVACSERNLRRPSHLKLPAFMRNNSAPEAVCPAPTRAIWSSSVAALLVPRSLVSWLRLVRVSCSWRARLRLAIAFAVKFSALGSGWQKFLCLRTKSLLYHHSNRDRLASRVFPRHRSFCRRSPRSRPAAHWSRQDPHPRFGFSAAPMPLWPQTLESACSARMSLRPDPRCCPLLELFLERGELLPQCFQLSS